MKNVKCNGKKVKITQKMFVKKDGVLGTILVADNCPYTNEKCSECQNCYGKIVLVEIDVFDSKLGDFRPTKTVLRDRFIENNKDIFAKLEATNYIDSCDIISISEQDKKDNHGSMTTPWFYGDRPVTWKTDCKMCKIRYEGCPPCQDVKKNRENGNPDHFCDKQKQRIMRFF